MAVIKTLKADLKARYGRYIKLSLIFTLALIIAAFRFSPKGKTIEPIDVDSTIWLTVDDIENTLIEFGNWGGTFPIETQFSNNIIRSQESADILKKDKATGFIKKENDVLSDFNYSENNPLKILDQLKEQKDFRNNEHFEKLYEFIKYRQNNPDPRKERL